MKCLACKSDKVEKETKDAGFVKVPSFRPKRVYRHVCLACGYVMTKVELDD